MSKYRQWAQSRRPRNRASNAQANSDAAEKISSMADAKRQYYNEKLTMKREQHEAYVREHKMRMEVLELQRKLYLKQLNED